MILDNLTRYIFLSGTNFFSLFFNIVSNSPNMFCKVILFQKNKCSICFVQLLKFSLFKDKQNYEKEKKSKLFFIRLS